MYRADLEGQRGWWQIWDLLFDCQPSVSRPAVLVNGLFELILWQDSDLHPDWW